MRISKRNIITLFVTIFAVLSVGFVVSSDSLQAEKDVKKTKERGPKSSSSEPTPSPSPTPESTPGPTPEPTPSPTPEPTPAPTDDTVLFGVSTPPGPHDLTELEAFEQAAGKAPGLYMYFRGFAYHGFEVEYAQAAVDRGSIPMITWEPWDYLNGVEQSTYSLRTIIDGQHDAYILDFARDAASWGGPLLLRFAHEMNASSYPWSEQTNGNKPGEYAQAWQHVHDLFASVGATNVEWVWSPNVSYDGTTPLEGLYPGDAYVDWVAADGYNGGNDLPWGGWLTFDEIFSSTLDELRALAPTKPVLIGEMASVEGGGDKAQWIRDFFSSLEARPYIKAFIWFNYNKEADWRIQSSSEATSAFADEVADPRYR